MPVLMLVLMGMPVAMVMLRFPVLERHVHPDAAYAVAGIGGDGQLEFMVQAELSQLGPQVSGIDPQADHGGQIHVAAYAGETVVEEYFHACMRSRASCLSLKSIIVFLKERDTTPVRT
jgi:hypothetical protein